MDTITIAKGGEAERTVKVQSIQIPDMWFLYTYLLEQSKSGIKCNRTWCKLQADMLHDCWLLAHAMKDTLQIYNKQEEL